MPLGSCVVFACASAGRHLACCSGWWGFGRQKLTAGGRLEQPREFMAWAVHKSGRRGELDGARWGFRLP